MLKHDDSRKRVLIANDKMSFVIDYSKGLRLSELEYQPSVPWLLGPVDFFILQVLGDRIPSSECRILDVIELKDSVQEGIAFEMESPVRNIRMRVSMLLEAQESFTLLYQMAASWEDEYQEEVFMHIPLFERFGSQQNRWYLSSNPVARPDGRSAMCLHSEYDLPICNIDPDRKRGFSMELKNYAGFIDAWNQNRNCDLLAITDGERLKKNKLLLRLSTDQLADVFEVRFFALENGWIEAFDGWRQRIREQMDLTEYDRKDLQWYKKVVYQHFTFAYSKEIFNYDTMEFEPERLIEDSKELGGIDSILLWYQYPRLGVDEQKQWDFNDNIPGGKEGMRQFCERARAKGVKVFLPYKPWDIRFDESPESIVEHMVSVIDETGIDGIWFDTMDSVPENFRERIDALRPGILFCTEVHPANTKCIEAITGSWDQHMNNDDMPEAFILRYMFPENNAPATNRWAVGKSKDNLINRCIFNGTGIAVWQDIFGAWLPFSPAHKKKLKHWKEILMAHLDTYFGKKPIPLVPTLQKDLYANRFISDDGMEIIYSVYNAGCENISGALVECDPGYVLQGELWSGKILEKKEGMIVGEATPGEVSIVCLKKEM